MKIKEVILLLLAVGGILFLMKLPFIIAVTIFVRVKLYDSWLMAIFFGVVLGWMLAEIFYSLIDLFYPFKKRFKRKKLIKQ